MSDAKQSISDGLTSINQIGKRKQNLRRIYKIGLDYVHQITKRRYIHGEA